MGKSLPIEVIQQIPILYATYGTYSKVAQILGIAPTTVKKYVTNSTVAQKIDTTFLIYNGMRPSNPDLPKENFLSLTIEEQESYKKLIEELENNATSN